LTPPFVQRRPAFEGLVRKNLWGFARTREFAFDEKGLGMKESHFASRQSQASFECFDSQRAL
jgi:hypothetical protein